VITQRSGVTVIVTGLIAQHPRIGGMTWHYLQYLIGLKALGHDVYYFEDSGEWPYTDDGGPNGDEWVAKDCLANITHLDEVMRRCGMADRWAYRFPLDGEWHGMPASRRAAVLRNADLLLNVSGTLEFPDRYRTVRCLAYIDSDPVFTQSRILNGSHGLGPRVDAHDVHFSFGERIEELGIDTGHSWLPTRQPIVIGEWHPDAPRGNSFSTVMNWTSYTPAVVHGRAYGQKDREFAKFIGVARSVSPLVIQIAMGRVQHDEWENAAIPEASGSGGVPHATGPHALLESWGWSVVESNDCCSDPDSYRRFIESSLGEWSVAKEAYAAFRPGWFSERSACYLAAGRPVVVQDTGFDAVLPVGKGLLSFRTPDEAVESLHEVAGSYAVHAEAARAIAEEYFDSSLVLERLIEGALSIHA
jgi:hypothetical protein